MGARLDIDMMLTIDDNGMPVAPNLRQLLDKDIRELYNRDKSPDKKRYIQEAIVIYYLGDPKSPAKQAGLSDREAIIMAIEQADLPSSYIPDKLVLKIITRYYNQNIGEAGRTVENLIKGIHNVNISLDVINTVINEKLKTSTDIEIIQELLLLVDNINNKASKLPAIINSLNEARQNLLYEKETEIARGGGVVSSSMDAENYID